MRRIFKGLLPMKVDQFIFLQTYFNIVFVFWDLVQHYLLTAELHEWGIIAVHVPCVELRNVYPHNNLITNQPQAVLLPGLVLTGKPARRLPVPALPPALKFHP
jgi:hypothetical protein